MIIGIEDRVRFRQKLAANIGKRNRAGSADKEFCRKLRFKRLNFFGNSRLSKIYLFRRFCKIQC